MAIFSRKHYETIALAMQWARTELDANSANGMAPDIYRNQAEQWRAACRYLADAFESDNGAFQRERFLNACVPGANVKKRARN